MMYRKPDTIQSVTRQIVGDSIEKRKLVAKLVKLVREDERRKVEASK